MPSLFSRIEESKKRNALKQIAINEYDQARGTYHKKLLQEARNRLEMDVKNSEREIKQLISSCNQKAYEQKEQLRQCLERYLISTKITEIPGIGQALGSVILNSVYHGNLTDLYRASAYSGIGETKQYAINIWVQKYQRKFPSLLITSFPGKDEIIKKSEEIISQYNAQIAFKQTENLIANEKIQTISQWIEKFSKTTKQDFITAKVDQIGNIENIENYINGVFSEWEPMPAWFKEVISEGVYAR
jgi:hypothetical protein